MAIAPLGPRSQEDEELIEDPHPGMLLRRNGRVTPIPLDRELQAALDWAAKEYEDPTRPKTRPFPEPSPSSSISRPRNSRRT